MATETGHWMKGWWDDTGFADQAPSGVVLIPVPPPVKPEEKEEPEEKELRAASPVAEAAPRKPRSKPEGTGA
jgi:hypothetical protein